MPCFVVDTSRRRPRSDADVAFQAFPTQTNLSLNHSPANASPPNTRHTKPVAGKVHNADTPLGKTNTSTLFMGWVDS